MYYDSIYGPYDAGFFALTGNSERLSYSLSYIGEGDISPEDYYTVGEMRGEVGDIHTMYVDWHCPEDCFSEYMCCTLSNLAKNEREYEIDGKQRERNLEVLFEHEPAISDGFDFHKHNEIIEKAFFSEITMEPGDVLTVTSYNTISNGHIVFILNDMNGIRLDNINIRVSGNTGKIEKENLGIQDDDIIYVSLDGAKYTQNKYFLTFENMSSSDVTGGFIIDPWYYGWGRGRENAD